MKKQQKIIELRRAAKLKVAELKTQIAVARSEAASERSRLMWERAAELEGLAAGSTERFDVLAKFRAKIAGVEEKLASKVAQLKSEIQQAKAECEQLCAAAEDDPETENETDNENDGDVDVRGFMPQKTVYCDGSEHSARIVACRIINKLPHLPEGGDMNVSILEDRYGNNREYFVSAICGDRLHQVLEIFSPRLHTAKLEAAFVEKVRRLFAEEPKSGNSHVAEPMAHALDAVFGGNPVEQVDNLISDTVKNRKEGGNE